MDIEEARAIYANPNGKTKEELKECIRLLNEALQPIELGDLQFRAISDACTRLGGSVMVIGGIPNSSCSIGIGLPIVNSAPTQPSLECIAEFRVAKREKDYWRPRWERGKKRRP